MKGLLFVLIAGTLIACSGSDKKTAPTAQNGTSVGDTLYYMIEYDSAGNEICMHANTQCTSITLRGMEKAIPIRYVPRSDSTIRRRIADNDVLYCSDCVNVDEYKRMIGHGSAEENLGL